MDTLGQLPEHEVCVVNTFLEIKEKTRKGLQRAGTAPASSLAAVDEHEESNQVNEVAVEATETKPIEEDMDVKKLPACFRKRPGLQRFDTPDFWEQQQILDELEEESNPLSSPPARVPTEGLGLPAAAVPAREPLTINLSSAAAQPPAAQQVPQVPSQVAMLLVAPMVCQPLQVTPVGSPCAPSRQLKEPEPPRLLGRTLSPRPTETVNVEQKPEHHENAQGSTLQPGALDQTSMASGSERIRWCVDGQKLDSHAEKLISPEFRLGANFGGALAESQPFRIMLLATQTGGKHGAGFKKAKGRGNIEIKCLGSYEGPSISLLVTVGSGSRKQKARELVKHNFAEKSCCPLAKGGRDPFVWDLKAALSKETKCVEVCIEVLPE
eukprot:symbB.v1.2.034092.t1/scaffold4322.1/size41248/3